MLVVNDSLMHTRLERVPHEAAMLAGRKCFRSCLSHENDTVHYHCYTTYSIFGKGTNTILYCPMCHILTYSNFTTTKLFEMIKQARWISETKVQDSSWLEIEWPTHPISSESLASYHIQ